MDFMHSMNSRFSFKAFSLGIVGVVAVYVGLFGYALFRSQNTNDTLQSRLATQTVLVDRFSQNDAAIETVEQLDASDLVDAPEAVDSGMHEAEGEDRPLENILGDRVKALAKSPIDGLYEKNKYGLLPVAKDKLQTPFNAYRKNSIINMERPYLAVAVENFGLSSSLSEALLSALPGSVSLVLSPYSQKPEDWAQAAREDGHEVWLHLPIENLNFPLQDPGAKGLLTRVSIQYNHDRLQWLLGRATGYAGVAAYTDDALNNAGPMFKNIARDVFKRGLGFLELNAAQYSFFTSVLNEEHVPHAAAYQYIDVVDPQDQAVAAVLNKIETQGGAVVVARPSPRNIPALKRWLESLEKRGIEIVPISTVAQANKG